jgi:hypothetical protein
VPLFTSRALELLGAWGATPNRRAFLSLALPVLATAGAIAGAVFTALAPLRERGSLASYASWIVTIYALLAVVVGTGIWLGDDPTVLGQPAVIVFLLGSGAAVGSLCAHWERDTAHQPLLERIDLRYQLFEQGLSTTEVEARRPYRVAALMFLGLFLLANWLTLAPSTWVVLLVLSVVGGLYSAVRASQRTTAWRAALSVGSFLSGFALIVWACQVFSDDKPRDGLSSRGVLVAAGIAGIILLFAAARLSHPDRAA